MLQQRPDDTANKLRDTAANILTANGFRIVTQDHDLFPNVKPDLAALKDDLLLVFAIKSFSLLGQFLRPTEINDIREELEAVVGQNKPAQDSRVKEVRSVALVMTPEDIVVSSEPQDTQWLVIRDIDELPEQLDRLLR